MISFHCRFFHRANVNQALRRLVRSPRFTVVAIAQMSLGIAGVVIAYTLLESLFFHPLSYPGGDRMVMIWSDNQVKDLLHLRVPPTVVDDLKAAHPTSLEEITEIQPVSEVLRQGTTGRQLHYARTDARYFSFFQMPVVAGRIFAKADALTSVVLSERVWSEVFRRDYNVIGTTVYLGSTPYTVIGVARSGAYPTSYDAWVPMDENWRSRTAHSVYVVGRLEPGISLQRCQAEMTQLARSFEQSYPETNTNWTFRVTTLRHEMLGNSPTVVIAASGAALLVLFIACFNNANLMITRLRSRQYEIALRLALGARRLDAMSDIVSETIIIGCAASFLGITAAYLVVKLWIAEALTQHWQQLPEIQMSWQVSLLVFMTTLCSALLVLVWPLIHTAHIHPATALTKYCIGDVRNVRISALLVAAEVGMTVCLVGGASLMIREIVRLGSVDPGFVARGVSTAECVLTGSQFQSVDQRQRYISSLQESARQHIAGADAQVTSSMPFSGSSEPFNTIVEGSGATELQDQKVAEFRSISTGYLQMMKIPLLHGRFLDNGDRLDAPRAILVNRTMAMRLWGNVNAVGRRLSVDGPGGPWRTVVGVVGDTHEELLDKEPLPEIYVPVAQDVPHRVTLALRTPNERPVSEKEIRRIFGDVGADVVPYHVSTAEVLLRNSFADASERARALEVCAVLALLLALCGVFCFFSYSAGQRVTEVAVRIALGSSRRAILRMFLVDSVRVITIGAMAGTVAVVALVRWADHASHLGGIGGVCLSVISGLGTCVAALTSVVIAVLPTIKIEPIRLLKEQ